MLRLCGTYNHCRPLPVAISQALFFAKQYRPHHQRTLRIQSLKRRVRPPRGGIHTLAVFGSAY